MNLSIDVPGKINLWLEVLRRRPDGYHELSSLMLPISLYDRLEISLLSRHSGIELECDHPEVPSDAGNLAWKAAASWIRAAGWKGGVHLHLFKSIPVGAGLGGGSADAAAVLKGMNRLLEDRIPKERLYQLAGELGADVPFFLDARPALATGIGERLQGVEGVPPYPLVLLKPPVSVSTRWVYQSLKLTRGESHIKLASFLTLPWRLQEVMTNDLETVTLNAYPVLVDMKAWLLHQGALGALMSGSGPTVFGVFSEVEAARRVSELAEKEWGDCYCAAAEVLSNSAVCEE